ncbi:MAG TPA: hypothetical protein VF427_04480 [Noviherbaspirillum sp.]
MSGAAPAGSSQPVAQFFVHALSVAPHLGQVEAQIQFRHVADGGLKIVDRAYSPRTA